MCESIRLLIVFMFEMLQQLPIERRARVIEAIQADRITGGIWRRSAELVPDLDGPLCCPVTAMLTAAEWSDTVHYPGPIADRVGVILGVRGSEVRTLAQAWDRLWDTDADRAIEQLLEALER